ncbi:hypothetical protein D3C86_2076040 [compost metagenome]
MPKIDMAVVMRWRGTRSAIIEYAAGINDASAAPTATRLANRAGKDLDRPAHTVAIDQIAKPPNSTLRLEKRSQAQPSG